MQKNRKTTQNLNKCKFDYLTSYKTLKNILRTSFHNWNSKNTKTIKTSACIKEKPTFRNQPHMH